MSLLVIQCTECGNTFGAIEGERSRCPRCNYVQGSPKPIPPPPQWNTDSEAWSHAAPPKSHSHCVRCNNRILECTCLGENLAPPPTQVVQEVVNEVVSLSGVTQTKDEATPKDLIGETKPPLWLVPPALEIFVSKVMELGARKYGAYNWRAKKVKAMVYVAAARRHLLQWQDGEDNDSESGMCHIAHAAACCGILLDALATGNLIDDRPAKGAAAKLIAQFTHKKP
jgi:hypothetical protein